MVTRRKILTSGTVAATGLLLSAHERWVRAAARGRVGTLDPTTIPKYATRLAIPPVMPTATRTADLDRYVIVVRQFRQQVLPPGLPATTVWGYGPDGRPDLFGWPAATIEARVDRPVQVTWANGLADRWGRFLPHLLPVDPTLLWANPPGGTTGRDSRPVFSSTPGPYRGPVPIVTHLHGGHSREESDGYPEAWYLPSARDIPAGYARVGSFYDEFRATFLARYRVPWPPGSAVFRYQNDQRATTEWYHDHTLGLTRLNVYAGLAGFYLLRGGPADLPPGVLPGRDPADRHAGDSRSFEIPMAIQDRSFNADGSLFYPASRAFFDDAGPYLPAGPFPPIWNPEFFGDTMTVNGRTWPKLTVEPRRYRLRLLNGCNSRFLVLALATDPYATRPVVPALPFWQIGNEGGFLPEPVRLDRLLLAPAERADVIVDFTGLPAGTTLHLLNEGPDGPFPGTGAPADPATTGQVMRFVVGRRRGPDLSTPPDRLVLPAIPPLGPATVTRRLALVEQLVDDRPVEVLLGTVDAAGNAVPLHWDDPVTEHPALNSAEIWEFDNRTADAHPIHIHEMHFALLGRGVDGTRPPEPWERGWKDTVIAYPGELTRVRIRFDLPGRYVWHCHLIEHEDNEMMRPYVIG